MNGSRHPLAVAFVILALFACGTATAIATTTGAKLTNDEYVLIGDSLAGASKALSGTKPNWQEARAACLVLGQSTPLLADQPRFVLGAVGRVARLAWDINSGPAVHPHDHHRACGRERT